MVDASWLVSFAKGADIRPYEGTNAVLTKASRMMIPHADVRRYKTPAAVGFYSLSENVSLTGLWSLNSNPVSMFSAVAVTLSDTMKPSIVVVYVTPF